MSRLLYLFILAIDIIIIFDILKSQKDTEKKILWIIAVIFLPVIGPTLYFIMGRNR